MSAPRYYDQEFRDRVVRMYRDRLAEPGEPGEPRLGARRHVDSLVDINQATSRNWIEQRYARDRRIGSGSRANNSTQTRHRRAHLVELVRSWLRWVDVLVLPPPVDQPGVATMGRHLPD